MFEYNLQEIYFLTYFLISQAKFSGEYIDSLSPVEVLLMYNEHMDFQRLQSEAVKNSQKQNNGINLYG